MSCLAQALNVASDTDGGPTLTQLWAEHHAGSTMLRQHTIGPAMCRCNMHLSDAGPLSTTLANIKMALGQCVLYTMWTHNRQHKALPRAEWMLASTRDASPTFNRHGSVSACTRCVHRRHQCCPVLNGCWPEPTKVDCQCLNCIGAV